MFGSVQCFFRFFFGFSFFFVAFISFNCLLAFHPGEWFLLFVHSILCFLVHYLILCVCLFFFFFLSAILSRNLKIAIHLFLLSLEFSIAWFVRSALHSISFWYYFPCPLITFSFFPLSVFCVSVCFSQLRIGFLFTPLFLAANSIQTNKKPTDASDLLVYFLIIFIVCPFLSRMEMHGLC